MDTTYRTPHAPHAAADETSRDARHASTPPADHDWDAVHDAALESFPASDPPSWSSLRAGSPRARG